MFNIKVFATFIALARRAPFRLTVYVEAVIPLIPVRFCYLLLKYFALTSDTYRLVSYKKKAYNA
jgi:hypothetical protein